MNRTCSSQWSFLEPDVQLLSLSNPHLPQSCQRIYRATLSCLPLYSVCANLPHSLTSWATVSPLLPHILHNVGFYCVINMKSRIICSQSLFLGATYQGLSTSFQIYFCNPLTKFYPSQYLPFLSHTAHAFFSASIHSPSPLLHSLWVHSLWDDVYIAISNFPE